MPLNFSHLYGPFLCLFGDTLDGNALRKWVVLSCTEILQRMHTSHFLCLLGKISRQAGDVLSRSFGYLWITAFIWLICYENGQQNLALIENLTAKRKLLSFSLQFYVPFFKKAEPLPAVCLLCVMYSLLGFSTNCSLSVWIASFLLHSCPTPSYQQNNSNFSLCSTTLPGEQEIMCTVASTGLHWPSRTQTM